MKRLMAASLAALVVLEAGPAGAAEFFKNLKLGGQIDLQATTAHNVADFVTQGNAATTHNDRLSDTQTRLMLQGEFDLLDDVHAVATVRKNDRTYGTAGGNPLPAAANTKSQPLITGGGTGVANNVFVDQAYFKIDKIAGQLDAAFGRQFYGESGDLVIYYGPSDKAQYGLPVTALDAGRFDWNSEWLGVTGLVAKIQGSPVGTAATTDQDLRGLNAAFKGNEWIKGTLYGWQRIQRNPGATGVPPSTGSAGGKDDILWVIGLKGKMTLGPWWLKAEYAQDLGENRVNSPSAAVTPAANYIGYAVLANTGLKFESESGHSFSLWGENLLASGRSNTREAHNDGFQAINGDYRPGTIYGRFAATPATSMSSFFGSNTEYTADPNNLYAPSSSPSNRWIFGGGIKYTPGFANRATFAASWWEYRMQRFAMTPGQTAEPYKGNRHIGAELDIDLTWVHSDNVAFAAGWANFKPGGLIQELHRSVATDQRYNNAQIVYFDARVKF